MKTLGSSLRDVILKANQTKVGHKFSFNEMRDLDSTLRQAGFIPGWKKEMVPTRHEDGRKTGGRYLLTEIR